MKHQLLIALTALTGLFGALQAEETLSIIKPDAVRGKHVGEIITRFETEGLHVGAIKMTELTARQAECFYAEHEGKPFFNDLVKFMTSGPIVVMVLKGDNAILKNREIMGSNSKEGTLRHQFASSATENAVHGSDSQASAKREIAFFFEPIEILN